MFKLILFFVFLVLSCTADQFEDECGLEGSYAVPLVKEGQEVMPREFPWHVAIFAWHYKNHRYEVICGGSLVMRDLVISAAHCFADENFEVTDEDDYQVVAGSQLDSWTSEERGKQTSEGRFPVRYVRLGEGYRGRERNYHADIAIVQLLYSFDLSDKVRTICLQPEMDMDNWLKSSDRLYGKVAGWGLLTELEVPSNTLKFLRVSVVGNEQCNDRMPATYRRHLIPDKVCVGLANGSSVCQGDSGGGLLLRHDARWYLYGVLSTAPNDTDKYEACPKTTIALYTNIQKYSSWLFKNLKELHRPAYTRPGTPCSTNGIVGVCQEYLLCLSAVEALGIGFQVEKCPNSEPIEVMVCCVSKEKAEEKGRMLGISANTSRNAGSINEQPGEGRPTNATASPGAACKIGGNIGNCQEYLQCPTAVRAAGLGYSIRDMMMDCPNSDPTGMTICCVSEEKADERGQIIGAFVNLGKSRVFAGSPNGEPRGTWTPRALECGLEGSYAVPLVKWGQEVKPREFPWHVAIFAWHYRSGRYDVKCGGSLVKRDLVISAAHCFADKNFEVTDEDDYQVVAGSQLDSWTSKERGKQTSEVRYVRLGEGYRGSERNYHADIAIVQLMYSFDLSDKVRTICLQPGMDVDNWPKSSDRLYGKVAGWGLTELEVPSNTLKFLRVSVIGNEQCDDRVPITYRRHLIPDKVCAGLADGSSVCQGDSGGGLVIRRDARWYLYGVLSTAPNDTNNCPEVCPETCPKTTIALYTNIQKYSSWLSKSLKELHRPAYTRPGTPCSTNGIVGDCREYLLCPSAVELSGLGFLPENCTNSEPIGLMTCCVSKEKAEEKGRMLGISANSSRSAGSTNEQPGEGRPTNATAYARPGAACKIGGNIGNCQEYLQCPTAVRAAGLGYSIRDMMTDCPNSDPTGTMICCVSEETAHGSGLLQGVYTNIGISYVYAKSTNGKPRVSWTPSAMGVLLALFPDLAEVCGGGLPPNAGSTDGQFGGGLPLKAGSTDGQFEGGLPGRQMDGSEENGRPTRDMRTKTIQNALYTIIKKISKSNRL